jgi:hypothetical protein
LPAINVAGVFRLHTPTGFADWRVPLKMTEVFLKVTAEGKTPA